MDLKASIKKFRKYLEITNANSIARRYFIMNSFDGIVTILGILTGALLTGLTHLHTILGISISAAIALAISGISGTLIAEMEERELEMRHLEESMLTDLKNSLYERAVKVSIIWVGIVDALSPFIATIIAVIPLFLGINSIIDPDISLYTSIALCLVYLTGIGMFMGKLVRKNPLAEALKLLGIGVLTTLIITLVLKL